MKRGDALPVSTWILDDPDPQHVVHSMYTLDTPESTTILGSNNTCALVAETTTGLYYISTYEPLSEILADVWHCNATGVYSVIDEGEGEEGGGIELDCL